MTATYMPNARVCRLLLVLPVIMLVLTLGGLVSGCAGNDTTTTAAGKTSTTLDIASTVAPTTSVSAEVPSTVHAAATGISSDGAMFRFDLERTGVYPDGGPTEFRGLVWKFNANDEVISSDYTNGVESSPTIADGVAYVGSEDGHRVRRHGVLRKLRHLLLRGGLRDRQGEMEVQDIR